MDSTSNPVEQLIEIGKQNQVLLSKIEANQTILLEMERESQKVETRNFYLSIAKYVGWGLMIYFSFVFSQGLVDKLTKNTLGSGGSGGENVNIEQLLKDGDVESLLKNMK